MDEPQKMLFSIIHSLHKISSMIVFSGCQSELKERSEVRACLLPQVVNKRQSGPVVQFSGYAGCIVTKVALKSQDAICTSRDNFDLDAKFRITCFTMIIATAATQPLLRLPLEMN
jgi:hypothetical protein